MISLSHIAVDYRLRRDQVHALRDVDLAVAAGEFVAIMGPSGSGKTTLIQVIAGLLTPTTGEAVVAGERLRALGDRAISAFRNRVIGFVFQGCHLPGYYTALDNVALPLVFAGLDEATRHERARALLAEFGLADRWQHRPDELSGGEAQRVAIARALVNDPKIILADEPTGNLDRETGGHALALLQQVNRDRGVTVVLVTHDEQAAACARRTVRLAAGRLVASQP